MKNLFYLVLFFSFIACGNSINEKVETTHPNGKRDKVCYYKNVDGKEILVEEKHYHLNGVLKMTGKFLNGKREGEWTAYFDNEQLQSSGIYKNGLRTGIAHIYFSNGKLLYEGMYKDDKETGHWKFYNKSGKLVNEKDFSLNY